jgi:hypothetical protein
MNNNLAHWFKYQQNMSKSFKESHWIRSESMNRYTQHKTTLTQQKEKLFKEKNVAKWGIPVEDTRRAVDVINDAELAFAMMLPAETKKAEYLSEEASFFTNQCYKEARRVVMQDYALGRW